MSLKQDISNYMLLMDDILQEKDSEIASLRKQASDTEDQLQNRAEDTSSETLEKLAEQVAAFVKTYDKNADKDSVLNVVKSDPEGLVDLLGKTASAMIRTPGSMGRVVKKRESTSTGKDSDQLFEERFLTLSRRIGD